MSAFPRQRAKWSVQGLRPNFLHLKLAEDGDLALIFVSS